MAAILFLSIKKFPQGWQTGMSWILDIDMLKYPKHQKHFVWTLMQRPVLCCRTIKTPRTERQRDLIPGTTN